MCLKQIYKIHESFTDLLNIVSKDMGKYNITVILLGNVVLKKLQQIYNFLWHRASSQRR